jgi:hypothetical protein
MMHLHNKVNRNKFLVWASQNLRRIVDHEWDFVIVNVFCALSHHQIYGLLFFVKHISVNIYMDILVSWHNFSLTESFSKAVRLLAFICRYEGICNIDGRW